VLFLAVGLIMTGHAILTPMLMVILMITGDFLAMSLTSDNVHPSATPNAWRIGPLTIAGVAMGVGDLIFCAAVLAVGKFRMDLGIDALRTLAFVSVVFGNEATLYAVRERRRLWSSRPGLWVIVSSVCDVLIVVVLATRGIAMASLPLFAVGEILMAAAVFSVILDFVKAPLFRSLRIGGESGKAASAAVPDQRSGPPPPGMPPDLKSETAKRAYELFEKRGRADGQTTQDWIEAEREIRKEHAGAKP
jgi:H+-transporting ATPase